MDRVAKMYAESLLSLALAKGGDVPAEVGAELDELCELVRGNAPFRQFLKSPIVDGKKREQSLKNILQGNVSDLLMKFILILSRKGRVGHLLEVGDAYDQIMQERFGKLEVDVFTVAGGVIPEDVAKSVSSRIKDTYGKDAVLHSYRDANMIGGIKLRIGDQLIDGSVATRLRRMRSAMIDAARHDLAVSPDRFMDDGGKKN
ncbi:MAG: ATP synthase F1 subunit delta [Planctomycetes bacterium]|nr:ATP synthase F1 subunit delta [Planctomycetota bacterium]